MDHTQTTPTSLAAPAVGPTELAESASQGGDPGGRRSRPEGLCAKTGLYDPAQ